MPLLILFSLYRHFDFILIDLDSELFNNVAFVKSVKKQINIECKLYGIHNEGTEFNKEKLSFVGISKFIEQPISKENLNKGSVDIIF